MKLSIFAFPCTSHEWWCVWRSVHTYTMTLYAHVIMEQKIYAGTAVLMNAYNAYTALFINKCYTIKKIIFILEKRASGLKFLRIEQSEMAFHHIIMAEIQIADFNSRCTVVSVVIFHGHGYLAPYLKSKHCKHFIGRSVAWVFCPIVCFLFYVWTGPAVLWSFPDIYCRYDPFICLFTYLIVV